MLKTPEKFLKLGDWEILINEAADYNFLDQFEN